MLSKKLSQITPSYTIGISTRVKALKSEGLEIIDLSIGEPDFNTPHVANAKAMDAISNGKTKYDLVPGLMDLRLAIVEKLKTENHIHYKADEIVVSSGAKHAITNTLLALLDPGDEVLLPAPYWTSYPEIIKLCGGVPVIIETSKENDFKLTVDQLKPYINMRTKLLLINNPSNPTGAVYSENELSPLVDVCVLENIFILADEIYERICFDQPFVSIPSLSEAARQQTILINGFSKSAAMTGWRLGYTASNATIAKAISTIQGHLVSHPSTISQWAGLGALTEGKEAMQKMVNTYKSRRDLLLPIIDALPDTTYVTPKGAFYLFIDLSAYRNKLTFDTSFSVAFSDKFLLEHQVAVVPGIAFGNDNYIRISYATDLHVVIEGLNRLKLLLNGL